MPTPIHTRLLTQAARDVLRPIGLTQQGRSRKWIDDHGWWVCLVVFDSSSWSKGSHLDVSAMWLWHDEHDFFHYCVGGRVELFVGFESESQFAPEAHRLAERAALEVRRYRELFPTPRAAAAFLEAEQHYPEALDAGVAWGLAGDLKRAAACFDQADLVLEGFWEKFVREVSSRSDEDRARARAQGVHYVEPSYGPRYRESLDEDHGRVARWRSALHGTHAFRDEAHAAITTVRTALKLPDVTLA